MTSYAELDRLRKLARPLYLELRALGLDIIAHEDLESANRAVVNGIGPRDWLETKFSRWLR